MLAPEALAFIAVLHRPAESLRLAAAKADADALRHADPSNEFVLELATSANTVEKLLTDGRMLSMCLLVTDIMPNLEDQDKVSGYIADHQNKKFYNFEFENMTPPVEICNELWKKI